MAWRATRKTCFILQSVLWQICARYLFACGARLCAWHTVARIIKLRTMALGINSFFILVVRSNFWLRKSKQQ